MTSLDPAARARELLGVSRLTDAALTGWLRGLPGVDQVGLQARAAGLSLSLIHISGFHRAAVAGHSGSMRSVAVGDTGARALVFGTRTHFYEGRGVRAVVHAVRTAKAAGCHTIVLTNGCGGLRPEWGPGSTVLIRDHINLTATSPIEGATFVDLTDLYSARLRAVCLLYTSRCV